jgi:UDP-N-acetylglucosamine--N-acetylmuramyl-(pentapeptide) pyrophosphoryl-undecaprenol N-acetylglucosamine transferase
MVIAGGGTGGHIFPGIAVADDFMARNEDAEVMFIGTEKGLEARVIPKEGYQIKFIKAEGVLGKSLFKKVGAFFKMFESVFASKAMLREAEPDVVVGTGGYVSVAPVVAARLLSLPVLILEQNLVPGFANRMLSKVADAVAVTYHESMSFFPRAKTYLTGNPIRPAITQGKREAAIELFKLDPEKTTVLVIGGSAGAASINNAMLSALNHMLDMKEEVQFLHQTGEPDYEGVRKAYRKLEFNAMVAPFVYQMAEAYAAADLVISRAGATTLAELTALGKPSIIIPYPYAAGHQEFNARKLLETGAAVMCVERDLTGEKLAVQVKDLCASEEKRKEMSKQAKALGRPDATSKVVDIAISLVKARVKHV